MCIPTYKSSTITVYLNNAKVISNSEVTKCSTVYKLGAHQSDCPFHPTLLPTPYNFTNILELIAYYLSCQYIDVPCII